MWPPDFCLQLEASCLQWLRWPGASQRESGRFARIDSREWIRSKTPIFITCERFARIASNLRFAIFSPLKRDSLKRGSIREPWNDSRESDDSRESANRFARIGPYKYSGAFLLTDDTFSFSSLQFELLAYNFSFFAYSWSFFAYSGKVRLIRALRDCKQRSLTVSKKTPTISEKASPKPKLGDRFLSIAGTGKNYALSARLPDPSPVLDKNLAPMSPEILSSTGAGVWGKAPMAFPDSSSVLDISRSAIQHSNHTSHLASDLTSRVPTIYTL